MPVSAIEAGIRYCGINEKDIIGIAFSRNKTANITGKIIEGIRKPLSGLQTYISNRYRSKNVNNCENPKIKNLKPFLNFI